MSSNKVLIDVMIDGRFYTQVRYDKHGWPEIIDGKIHEVRRDSDMEKFVLDKLPSLKGKDYRLRIADQIVFR